MKTRLAIAAALALLIGCSSTTPAAAPSAAAGVIDRITWNLNPPIQQITTYRVYRVVGKSRVLQATVVAPPYRPSKHGTYYITAVNSRGQSAPSKRVTL